jgi:quinol monooxygenase YgiN
MTDPKVILEAVVHGLGGRQAELARLLADLAASAQADEPGCLAFRALAGGDEPGDFVVLAHFADEAALRAHYATAHYRRYRDAAGPLLARPSDAVLYYVERAVRAEDPDPPDPARY